MTVRVTLLVVNSGDHFVCGVSLDFVLPNFLLNGAEFEVFWRLYFITYLVLSALA